MASFALMLLEILLLFGCTEAQLAVYNLTDCDKTCLAVYQDLFPSSCPTNNLANEHLECDRWASDWVSQVLECAQDETGCGSQADYEALDTYVSSVYEMYMSSQHNSATVLGTPVSAKTGSTTTSVTSSTPKSSPSSSTASQTSSFTRTSTLASTTSVSHSSSSTNIIIITSPSPPPTTTPPTSLKTAYTQTSPQSTTLPPPPPPAPSSSLPPATKAGIAVGATAGALALIALITYRVVRHSSSSRREHATTAAEKRSSAAIVEAADVADERYRRMGTGVSMKGWKQDERDDEGIEGMPSPFVPGRLELHG